MVFANVSNVSVADRYTGGDYLAANSTWHVEDSPWKADQVQRALGGYIPDAVCEVGCGAGEILRQLHDRYPSTSFVGYDIAYEAIELARPRQTERLRFVQADVSESSDHYDVMLVMDVIEHVPDPIGFLAGLRARTDRLMVHIPLDLSVLSVLRPEDLSAKRQSLGHIHYYTPETAMATVAAAGYTVTKALPTRTFDLWGPSWKGRAARRVIPERLAIRVLGGYSILVCAE
jgi:hypothetical protein